MRLYTFCNMYISSIQCGIQTAHIVSELYDKYLHIGTGTTKQITELNTWAKNHKTIIVCNGGYSSALRELIEFFNVDLHSFPWTSFNEDDNALDGALTCVGVVLPEYIYNTMDIVCVNTNRATRIYEADVLVLEQIPYLCEIKNKGQLLTEYDFQLAKKIKQYSLAR